MGNTLVDFKAGRTDQYRDRLEWKDFKSALGNPWYQVKPTTGIKYSSGSLSRCVDKTNPGFHRFMRARLAGRHGKNLRNIDVGGPLCIERSSLTMPTIVDEQWRSFGYPKGYQGVLFPSNTYKQAMQNLTALKAPPISSTLGISRGELVALGSTAIAKSIPDIPDFSLFRYIGELRAGLPKIPLKTLAKEKKFREVGGEYLNVQFGILPTISDTQKLLELLANPALRSAVKRTLHEEHRVRKTLSKDLTSTKRALTSTELNTVQDTAARSGTLEVITDHRIWSSCSFVYLQASRLDRLLSDLDEGLGGLGVVPTAIDLWNLTAWSWFVDWFVNFNHVITSLSYLGKDGLYMQRGYLMASYSTREIHHQTGFLNGKPYSTTGLIKTERKYRVAASPFGFGYTWKDFSPFQLSILGALGVSRLRF